MGGDVHLRRQCLLGSSSLGSLGRHLGDHCSEQSGVPMLGMDADTWDVLPKQEVSSMQPQL